MFLAMRPVRRNYTLTVPATAPIIAAQTKPHGTLTRFLASSPRGEVAFGTPSRRRVRAKPGQKRWSVGSKVHVLQRLGGLMLVAARNVDLAWISALLHASSRPWHQMATTLNSKLHGTGSSKIRSCVQISLSQRLPAWRS